MIIVGRGRNVFRASDSDHRRHILLIILEWIQWWYLITRVPRYPGNPGTGGTNGNIIVNTIATPILGYRYPGRNFPIWYSGMVEFIFFIGLVTALLGVEFLLKMFHFDLTLLVILSPPFF